MKVIFRTEDGKGYTMEDVNSLLDYYNRTGRCDSNFTDNDYDRFEKKFIYNLSRNRDEIDPAGGFGIKSHI